MYSTSWCGDCRRAKRFLREAGIDFSEIDIDKDEKAAQQVVDWSGGRRVIPTFYITKDDDKIPTILHNPRLSLLAEAVTNTQTGARTPV